jgi:RNA recognition motif-containing protein
MSEETKEKQENYLIHISDIPKDCERSEIERFFTEQCNFSPTILVMKDHWNTSIPTKWAQIDLQNKDRFDLVMNNHKFPVFKNGIQSRILKNVEDKKWLRDNTANLVVRKLDKSAIDNDTLLREFEKIGNVVCCKVSKTMKEEEDKSVSAVSNGYGYVRFNEEKEALKAVK